MIANVMNGDGSDADYGAINTICKTGNTGDFTEEHMSGQFYLDVQSEGQWTMKVEVYE